MELHIEHEIGAPIERVEAARLAPGTLERLPEFAPGIAEARELSRERTADVIERVALCRAAYVPPRLRAVIPAEWTSWYERTRWDLRARTATFTIEPRIPPALRRRVVCEGDYRLSALAGGRTRRAIDVRLRIDSPVIGRRVEAILGRLLEQQFAGEATLLGELAGGAE